MKAAIAVTLITEEVLNIRQIIKSSKLLRDIPALSSNTTQKLVQQGTDALAFLGRANHQVNMIRRENLKPVLKKDYSPLCDNVDIPVTNYLFGDDLHKSLREAKQVAALGNTATTSGYKSPQNSKNFYGHNNQKRFYQNKNKNFKNRTTIKRSGPQETKPIKARGSGPEHSS